MRIRVLVEDELVEFVGLRGTDLWCCGAMVAEATVLIVGVRWDAAVPKLARIENPRPAGSPHASEVADDVRLRRDWDEAVREEPIAVSTDSMGAIVVDQPEQLMVALHVRDAAQLTVHASHTIPPLIPDVTRLAHVDEAIRSEASSQWPSWWRGLANSVDRAVALGAQPPAHLVDDPELGILIERDLDSALDWARQRKSEFMADHHRGPEWEVATRHAANLTDQRTIRVSVLPLRGKFGTLISGRHLLASQELRKDSQAYSAWLEQTLWHLS
jgi:hypothetical protein